MFSFCKVTDTPTVGARSEGNGGSFCLARFGGTRMNASSTARGCSNSTMSFFNKPASGISVLPRDWSPQQRWIYLKNEMKKGGMQK